MNNKVPENKDTSEQLVEDPEGEMAHVQPPSYANKKNYVFGKTLGAGTFGVVRQARNSDTGEDVAVKILIKKALKGNEIQLQALYDELDILQRLHHPNIVAFKDWFESKDKFYIITQLAKGGELFDRILKKGKFTEVDAVTILIEILSAVQYMHSQNIVHRDLKPENLLYIDESDQSPLVIADFGIAKRLKSDEELIYKPAGSLGYVAPEVLTQDGHGKPCDIWSIGVITYTLLCGYSAFKAERVQDFLDECTTGEYPVRFHRPYWDSVSDKAKRFILKALDLDPAKRPTAAQLLEDPWIICTELKTHNLLPGLKEGLDARQKFRNSVERVRLNMKIQKLRDLYLEQTESDSDFDEGSQVNGSTPSLKSRDTDQLPNNLSAGKQSKSKSQLTSEAFAQLVNTVLAEKEKFLDINRVCSSDSDIAENNKKPLGETETPIKEKDTVTKS
ncbi:cmk1p [Saccharomyces arboricola H-6]|uniref:Cmk1p n=1 Tax=Saccharomyces arboricola (strain H-6 / AS 2.3317 / CBS 10644) TaxID=1160507 RepID=J8PP22_SACAR|nr:cmk1p [Saccharomyces arboricola H-6]